MNADTKRNPWLWVPSLYFAEGIPYVVVMTVSVIMYKRLGISNTDIALYTSWLYLPWVIKPLWSPLVDLFKTKRHWIVVMQLLIGAGLGGVALTLPLDDFFRWSLAVLWLLAFSSATHDIAADGFYMLGLSKHDQAWFVGVRSTFYRLAMITGQGLLIMLAGGLESRTGLAPAQISISTKAGADVVQTLDPKSVERPRSEGEFALMANVASLNLGITPRDKAEVDALVAQAKAWNKEHGFYADVAAVQKKSEPSWWSKNVSGPLADSLRKSFPCEKKVATVSQSGNLGVVFFQLTKQVPAGEHVVVNVSRESGDKSIKLVEGERFTFTDKNWDKPFMALVQLDPKLKEEVTAVFVARSGNLPLAWSLLFFVLAGMFVVLFLYHRWSLPRPESDAPTASGANVFSEFLGTLGSFFQRPGILKILAFILLYRFAEAQLVKMVSPFLLDAREAGGLGLSTSAVGVTYGTVGIIALTIGGLCGGFVAARQGLKFWLPIMVCFIHLPNLAFVYLSYTQPENLLVINACVAVEQFGYGFGFTAYMLYLIYVADGPHKTAHYAICTGLMALGMMVPGMFSGWLQEIIGYQKFFVWVMLATIPGFAVAFLVKVDPEFGKKMAETK